MIITVLDTSVCTENLGDFISMDAVRCQLMELFPDAIGDGGNTKNFKG